MRATLRGTLKAKTIVAVLSCLISISAFAQDAKKEAVENTDPKELKQGVVASSGKSGASSLSVEAETGDSEPGGEASPVSASVNKVGRGKCEAKFTNKSEQSSYAVRYRVTGVAANGRESFRRVFSATLGPKKSSSQSFSCKEDLNLSVELVSGKKIS